MIEDEFIIENCIRGNAYYFNLLVDRYKNLLYKLCNNLTKNTTDADDLFQDTWLKIMENLSKYDSKKSFKTWIITICINTYKDKYNKRKRWIKIVNDYFSNNQKDEEFSKLTKEENLPEKHLLKIEERDYIRKVLNLLDDKYRIPLILYYFKEISYKEIAATLEIPIGTVKSRINIGKQKLKSNLKEEHYE
ncbi:MAG: RNA polymerase sigma factor [Eubacteriales bacterium]